MLVMVEIMILEVVMQLTKVVLKETTGDQTPFPMLSVRMIHTTTASLTLLSGITLCHVIITMAQVIHVFVCVCVCI